MSSAIPENQKDGDNATQIEEKVNEDVHTSVPDAIEVKAKGDVEPSEYMKWGYDDFSENTAPNTESSFRRANKIPFSQSIGKFVAIILNDIFPAQRGVDKEVENVFWPLANGENLTSLHEVFIFSLSFQFYRLPVTSCFVRSTQWAKFFSGPSSREVSTAFMFWT